MALGGVCLALCKLMACPLLPPMAAPLSLKQPSNLHSFNRNICFSPLVVSFTSAVVVTGHVLFFIHPYCSDLSRGSFFMLCLLNDYSNSSLHLLMVSLGLKENSPGEAACCFLVWVKVCQIWQATWDTLKRKFHYVVSATCTVVTNVPAKNGNPSFL